MNENPSAPRPDQPHQDISSASIPHDLSADPGLPGRSGAPARSLVLLFLAGLAVGLLAAVIGEKSHDYFPPGRRLVQLQGNNMMEPTKETRMVATRRNGTLLNAELGALMGLAMGAVGGLLRRSTRSAIVAGLLGLVLGGVLGAIVPAGVFPLFYAARHYSQTTEPDLLVSLVMHAAQWGVVGGAAGLAFAIGYGPRGVLGRAVLGGILGAVLAAVLYEPVGAILFPMGGSGEPIAESWEPRALPMLLVPVFSALAIGLFALESRRART